MSLFTELSPFLIKDIVGTLVLNEWEVGGSSETKTETYEYCGLTRTDLRVTVLARIYCPICQKLLFRRFKSRKYRFLNRDYYKLADFQRDQLEHDLLWTLNGDEIYTNGRPFSHFCFRQNPCS